MSTSDLSSHQIERYSRQLILRGVGGRGQQRLSSSSVLVVGAGGLGSPVLMYLAASGIGQLGIADPDIVELSNLGRQILYSMDTLGFPKAQAAAQALKRLNPWVDFKPLQEKVDSASVARLAGGYDLLIDCSDGFAAKFAVNDEAVRSHRSCVIGSAVGFAGQVLTITVDSGCYRCLFEEEPPAEVAQSCQDAGVFGPLVGLMGSLQASEALRILLRLGDSRGSVIQANLDSQEFRRIALPKRLGCTACAAVQPRVN